MADSTKTEVKRDREVFYYRKRLKNRIFARLSAFFAEESERTGITKSDIAARLKKDPAQITRWLSGPSNLTLDTLSDLLLALDAEVETPRIVRFEDRPEANYIHPLIAKISGHDQGVVDERISSQLSLSDSQITTFPTTISSSQTAFQQRPPDNYPGTTG